MKPRVVPRALRALGLVLFAGGFLFWLAHVPRRPERLVRAIPAEAVFVWLHSRPASHWDAIRPNPVFRAVCSELGIRGADLDAAGADPGFNAWMQALASDEVALFLLPARGHAPAYWGAASWIGARSHRMRWMLKSGRIPGFLRAGEYQGRTLWGWRDPDGPADQAIFLALEEGMVIACLADHPSALVRLLSAYDGTIPSFDARRLDPGPMGPGAGVGLLTRPGPLHFELRSIGPDRLEGAVSWPAVGGAPEPLGSAWEADPPEERAEILARVSPELVRRWFASDWAPEGAEALLPALEPLLRGPVTLALYGGDLSGRIYGMRIPALVASAGLGEGEDADARIGEILDALNAAYRAGLIAPPPAPGGPPVRMLEPAAGGAYAAVPREERAGFMAWDGRLFLASHTGVLRALAATPSAAAGGPPDLDREAEAAASLRADWNRGAPSLRSALAVLSLRAALAGGLDPRDRERLRMAREWSQAVEPLGRMNATLFRLGDRMRLEFGPPPDAPPPP